VHAFLELIALLVNSYIIEYEGIAHQEADLMEIQNELTVFVQGVLGPNIYVRLIKEKNIAQDGKQSRVRPIRYGIHLLLRKP
jgi:hypothetical protein